MFFIVQCVVCFWSCVCCRGSGLTPLFRASRETFLSPRSNLNRENVEGSYSKIIPRKSPKTFIRFNKRLVAQASPDVGPKSEGQAASQPWQSSRRRLQGKRQRRAEQNTEVHRRGRANYQPRRGVAGARNQSAASPSSLRARQETRIAEHPHK